MFVVVWECAGGGGGHQVALTEGRAETIHRALCRALPGVECRIEPLQGFGPGVAVEPRQDRRQPRRRVSAGREGRRGLSKRA